MTHTVIVTVRDNETGQEWVLSDDPWVESGLPVSETPLALLRAIRVIIGTREGASILERAVIVARRAGYYEKGMKNAVNTFSEDPV